MWRQIQDFAGQLRGLSYAEIHDRLTDYQRQLVGIVEKYAPPGGGVAVASGSPTVAPSQSPSAPGATGSSAAAGGGSDPAGSSQAGSTVPGESANPDGFRVGVAVCVGVSVAEFGGRLGRAHRVADLDALTGAYPVPRSSSRPARSRDHWAVGRPSRLNWPPTVSKDCGQPSGESSQTSCRP